MKRAALGALLISLVAASTAMAGNVLASAGERHYDNRHHNGHDNRGRGGRDYGRDNGRRDHNWNHRDDGRNDGHRDGRWDGRRDDRNWDGRRDNRWDGRRDDRNWDGRRFDDRRRYDPPRYSPPRRYDPPRFSSRPYPAHRFENGRWHWGSYYRPHGYSVRHWVRGDRLPRAYYGPTYVVSNYYDCGLRRPPYGYHWVRVDHDVILAAVATGIVLDVVYNQFW